MKTNVVAVSLALLVTGLLLVFEIRAQPSNADTTRAKEQARAHFERGVTLARDGKLEAAVEEFEGAYRLSPHYSVLFNLGQARAAMGQPVEAVDAFRRYLDEGGTSIDAARRAHVTELIAFHEKRIGSLRLEVEPDGAEVWLDGRLVGKSPLSKPVRLVEGSHGVAVSKWGFVSTERAVFITPGSTTELALRAERAAAGSMREPDGLLVVRCPVPDVEVSIDEGFVGLTSSGNTFRAPLGRTSIRLARSGYVSDARTVEVSATHPAEVACRLELDAKGPRGALRVSSRPADGIVWVNGQRFRGEPLPIGRHALRVERPGYHPFATFVRIEASKTAQVAANLRPTKEQKDAWQKERSNRTTWAIATTIAGVVLAGTSIGTYVWNSERYDDWVADRRALDAELEQGPATPAMLDENEALNRRSRGIERADIMAVGLGLAGAVTLGISGALWIGVAEGPNTP